MNLYQTYERDTDKERNGVECELLPGVKMTVARAGGSNREYVKERDKLTKPYRLGGTELSEKDETELQATLFARTIVKGWEGVTDRDGNPLDFTEENVRKVLLDLPDVFDVVKLYAINGERYSVEVAEETAKN
jgi:hypothetical protein